MMNYSNWIFAGNISGGNEILTVCVTAFSSVILVLSCLAGLILLMGVIFPVREKNRDIPAEPALFASDESADNAINVSDLSQNDPPEDIKGQASDFQGDDQESIEAKRRRIAAAVAVLMEIENASSVKIDNQEAKSCSWKMAGRLERMGSSGGSNWRRS